MRKGNEGVSKTEMVVRNDSTIRNFLNLSGEYIWSDECTVEKGNAGIWKKHGFFF